MTILLLCVLGGAYVNMCSRQTHIFVCEEATVRLLVSCSITLCHIHTKQYLIEPGARLATSNESVSNPHDAGVNKHLTEPTFISMFYF